MMETKLLSLEAMSSRAQSRSRTGDEGYKHTIIPEWRWLLHSLESLSHRHSYCRKYKSVLRFKLMSSCLGEGSVFHSGYMNLYPHSTSWFIWWRICLQCQRPRFDPWLGKIPLRREWLPTPASWSGEVHGQRCLLSNSQWSCKDLDTTELPLKVH